MILSCNFNDISYFKFLIILLLVANPCDARDSLKRKKQYCNYHLMHEIKMSQDSLIK